MPKLFAPEQYWNLTPEGTTEANPMTTQQAATQIRRILADPDSPITQQMLRDWLEALERTEK